MKKLQTFNQFCFLIFYFLIFLFIRTDFKLRVDSLLLSGLPNQEE